MRVGSKLNFAKQLAESARAAYKDGQNEQESTGVKWANAYLMMYS